MTSLFRFEQYIDGYVENLRSQTLYPDLNWNVRVIQPTSREMERLDALLSSLECTVSISFAGAHERLYETWNRILEDVSSDYVAIWNVDDRRTLNSLELQLVEHRAQPSVVAVYGPFVMVDSLGSTSGFIPELAAPDDSRLGREMHLGPFFSFRTEALTELHGFDEQLSIAGDFDFAIRLHSLGKLARTQGNLGYFLNGGAGLSTRSSSQLWREVQFVVHRYARLPRRFIADVLQPRLDSRMIHVAGARYRVPSRRR